MRRESETSDEALARAAAAGQRQALEDLLGRHVDRIHAICRRVTGHPEDALDATQEALLAVARGIHRYDGRSAFTTWLYRVATNAALDELRRRSRRPVPTEPVGDGPAGPGSVDGMVGARIDVDAALATLAPEFRAAVVLRDLCDLDYAEISETLGVPIGTVRSRIARGRAAIAAHLSAGEKHRGAPPSPSEFRGTPPDPSEFRGTPPDPSEFRGTPPDPSEFRGTPPDPREGGEPDVRSQRQNL